MRVIQIIISTFSALLVSIASIATLASTKPTLAIITLNTVLIIVFGILIYLHIPRRL